MHSRLLLVALVSAGLAPAGFAAPPADKDECFARAFELAAKASKKKLAPDQASDIEGRLVKMESECSSGAFDKADASAAEIEKTLSGG